MQRGKHTEQIHEIGDEVAALTLAMWCAQARIIIEDTVSITKSTQTSADNDHYDGIIELANTTTTTRQLYDLSRAECHNCT